MIMVGVSYGPDFFPAPSPSGVVMLDPATGHFDLNQSIPLPQSAISWPQPVIVSMAVEPATGDIHYIGGGNTTVLHRYTAPSAKTSKSARWTGRCSFGSQVMLMCSRERAGIVTTDWPPTPRGIYQ
jgi:hypothetical protein